MLLTRPTALSPARRRSRWARGGRRAAVPADDDMQNRRIVDGIFAEAGAEPRPTVETNSISTLYAHVRDGGWSSVIAHAWLHVFELPAGLRAIPLVEPETTRSIGLVVLDRDPEPLLARALLDVAAGLDLEAALEPGRTYLPRSITSPETSGK